VTLEDQEAIIKGMGEAVGRLSEEFVLKALGKFLTTVDSILSDSTMTDVEKFGSIKVVMDVGWKRITAITHGDPSLTITDLAAMEASKSILTGDKGMDDAILDIMGLSRKE